MPAVTRPLTPNELLASVVPWVNRLSHRAARRYNLDPDEVFQECAVRLLRYAPRYQSWRGKPTTWASCVIRSTVARLVDVRNRKGEIPASRRVSINLHDELARGLSDHRSPSPLSVAGEREESRAMSTRLAAALEALPPRLRRIVEARFLASEPLTLGELGQELGITRERVRQLEAKALRMMGEVLGGRAA
jgi:RNA polymerase sigma factor (sigma-70 family)